MPVFLIVLWFHSGKAISHGTFSGVMTVAQVEGYTDVRLFRQGWIIGNLCIWIIGGDFQIGKLIFRKYSRLFQWFPLNLIFN